MAPNPLPQPEMIPPVWTQRRAPEKVACRNWPLAQGDPFAWASTLAALLIAGVVAWVTSSLPAAICAGIALAASLWRNLLPVDWEFGLSGVSQTVWRRTRRIPWIAIAKYEAQPHGVWLFADRSGSPLQGVYIDYAGQEAGILANLQYYLGAWTSSGDTTTETLQVNTELDPSRK
jgi:hypothetical protein